MSQVNRIIRDNPLLDDVDHALGRPYNPDKTYRNYYTTGCNKQRTRFRASPWWSEGSTVNATTSFYVTADGIEALKNELKRADKYGRLYEITSVEYGGVSYQMAQSNSQAKYLAYLNADIDWPFIEYCKEIRVRLAQ